MDLRSNYGFSSSPHSSDEAESHRGTPDTKLTGYSPEDVRDTERSVDVINVVDQNGPPAFAILPTTSETSPQSHGVFKATSSQDPFVTVSRSMNGSKRRNDPPKLSPTASSFTPLGGFGKTAVDAKAGTPNYAPAVPSGLSYLSAMSLPDNPPDDQQLKAYLQSVASEATAVPSIGQRMATGITATVKSAEYELVNVFTVDTKMTRSLMISNITRKISATEVNESFNVSLPRLRTCCHILASTLIACR